MPASTSMTPPSWEEMSHAERMADGESWSAARRYAWALRSLRHIVWCNADQLNDNQRAHIHEQLLALGVRR